MPEKAEICIGKYESYPFAIYRILCIGIILNILFWWLAWKYPGFNDAISLNSHNSDQNRERMLFCFYLNFWVVSWVIYFLSGTNIKVFKIRSLRRLLKETSAEWESFDHKDGGYDSDEERYYDEMSSKTMTAIAVLAGVSLAVLAHTFSLFQNHDVDSWLMFLLGFGALCGSFAFVGFVLSLDLLDSIFVNYKSEALKIRLQHFFFGMMVNRRYPALIALLTASILIGAYYNSLLGCSMIGLYYLVGNRNWFPTINANGESCKEKHLFNAFSLILLFYPAIEVVRI